MLIKTTPANRRRVLKGLLGGGAVTVSLPLLDLFLNDGGTAMAAGAPLPARFGTWFWGLGMNSEVFTPKTFGADWQLTEQLKALDKVKPYLNVYSNYDVLTDGKSNLCHYTGWVALRTGSTPGNRTVLPGQSLDVAISDTIGGGTRFRSISLAATG